MAFAVGVPLLLLAAGGPPYRRYPSSYCQAIHCSGAHCSGALSASAVSRSACESQCEAERCSCWQWRDPSAKHPSPREPACLTTNGSTAVKPSTYGYAANVDTGSAPLATSPISNFACRPGTGSDHHQFCNNSLPIEARLDDLVAQMTLDEKASQLQARSSPPIDRLGIPFFCWSVHKRPGPAVARDSVF